MSPEQAAVAPTVGRIVHVRRYEDEARACLAGVVAKVWSPGTINVGGFDADGHPFSATSVTEDDGSSSRGTHWHWPERA